MKILASVLAFLFLGMATDFSARPALAQVVAPPALVWPAGLPVYDHVVIVIEENKDYDQIVGSKSASYINGVLRKEGATLTKMFGEEHHSQGNYFWLFSGSNQGVGYTDAVPHSKFSTGNLGEGLIRAGRTFKGYSENLPAIGSAVGREGLYARKHVPWVSFSNVPNGNTAADSANLRFPQDFPSDYSLLPTVSFVIPNLANDMHDGGIPQSVVAGDKFLQNHLDAYYQWAKKHDSLLIVTCDESAEFTMIGGMTSPANKEPGKRNRIPTFLAGAHIKAGEYDEGKGVNHVSLLRTLEAMYKLERSGGQTFQALRAGIADDFVITDIFDVPASGAAEQH